MDWVDVARKERERQGDIKHGPIHPRTDKRCFLKEVLEDLLDGLNYAQWAREKGEINRQKWRWLDSTLRNAITITESACENRWWWKLEAYDERLLHRQ